MADSFSSRYILFLFFVLNPGGFFLLQRFMVHSTKSRSRNLWGCSRKSNLELSLNFDFLKKQRQRNATNLELTIQDGGREHKQQ